MKLNFTKITLLFATFLFSASLFGQRFYNLNIDGQDPLLTWSATFGPCVEAVSGELVAAEPILGCSSDPITNGAALAGKIAVIDRGGNCAFNEKIFNAQSAGAIAVIICNNQPSADGIEGLIPMGFDTVNNVEINILGFMVSQANCIGLKTNLPVQAIIKPEFDETPAEKVLWGNEPGQGDFDGGLNGWSSVTVECNGAPSEVATWKWEEDGVSEGALGNGFAAGPTFCNGAAGFNSDFLDNGGNDEFDASGNLLGAGTGDCPAPQIGELISPIIDISGSGVAGVSVEFYQDARQFQSRYFVEYSLDGGLNYVVASEVNDELSPNDATGNFKMSIPLPGAEGASQLRVKFTYLGDYYYWVIDDVKIIEREANNLRVNENFFATAPNVKVPKSQIDPIHFLADIQNIGAVTQENTSLNMTVTNDDTGEVVFSNDLAYGSITSDSLAENKLFESTFTPAEVVANYTGVYTVSSSAADFDSTDNSRTISFQVTDYEFANEDGTNLGAVVINDPAQIPTWSMGNYFYVPKGQGFRVSKFGIGIGNADEVGGLGVGIRMFKWTDIDADSDDSGFPEAAPDEREFIAFADYEILGNELPEDVNWVDEIFTADGDALPINLEDDAHYLVMMTMDAEVGVSAKEDLYNSYLAMNTATTQAGTPRYWSFFGPSSDIFETVYDANNSFTPLVRMEIEETVGTSEALPADNIITLNPNPATEFVNLNMDFTKSFETVNIIVSDVAGRVVLMQELKNIKNHQMRIDVANLMSGVYNVNISTEDGIRTEKFIKVE